MRKLDAALGVLVFVALGLIASSDGAYAQEEGDVCDILDSPQRLFLSGAGEMMLMEMCGRMPPPPAPATDQLSETIRSTSTEGMAPTNGVHPDVQVNAIPDPEPHTTQSEVSLALTGGTLVAGWNDSSDWDTAGSYNGYAVSTDGGATWTDRGALLPVSPIQENKGDPWIRAHDATGNFYYATMAIGGGSVARPIIAVYTGATPGIAPDWPAATNVTPGELGSLQDKEAMDVDNTGGPFDGRVYVCWRQFAGTRNIKLSINDTTGVDAALAHVDVLDMSAPDTNTFTQGCYVEVDQSNGDVYVAWENFDDPRTIRARRSVDGGGTFGSEVTLATLVNIGHINTTCCDGRQVMNGDIRVLEFISSMAVNPLTGNLHVVYASDGDGAGPDEGDVFHVRCSPTGVDGIGSCTAPFKLNSDATTLDQWHPFIDAEPKNGTLAVFWYDRREDPNNWAINVFKRFSTDDGVSWTPDEKVTDVPFGVPPLCPNFDPNFVSCYMGEYNHITSDATGFFFFVWGDNRNRVSGRPDPDIFFEKECPVGACCLQPRGNCIDTTRADCDAQGGWFFCNCSCSTFPDCPSPFDQCPSQVGPGFEP
jgi:hypothetical protein